MLSEDQIDYLFQIKESKQAIPEGTLRVMFKALRWTPEEIRHGIAFLKRAPQEETPEAARARLASLAPQKPAEPRQPSINIKQNPFPIGSPFAAALKKHQKKRHKRLTLLGAVIGALVFLAGLIIYARFGSAAGV